MTRRLSILISIILVAILSVACVPAGATAEPLPENTEAIEPTTVAESTIPILPTEEAPSAPVVENPQLTTMRFFDASNGWGMAESSVLRTEDGGVTWLDVTPADMTGLGFGTVGYFLDNVHGWVAVANPFDPMEAGLLYRTSDGGATWEESTFVAGMGGRFSFVEPSNGFFMADLGAGAGSNWVAIYSTTDGGATWSPAFAHEPGMPEDESALPGSGQKSGMTFRDTTHGWVTGNIPMDNFVYLYASADGGQTWTLQPVSTPADLGTVFADTYPPVFFGEDGIMPVTLISNVINLAIYTSADGGASWVNSPAFVADAGRGDLVDFVTPEDGFAWANGRFAVTHDAAHSWETVTPSVPFGDSLMAMDFVDASTGWVLTYNTDNHTSLYKTIDGGATWATLIP